MSMYSGTAIDVARKCDVSDLIFRFNCAKYFYAKSAGDLDRGTGSNTDRCQPFGAITEKRHLPSPAVSAVNPGKPEKIGMREYHRFPNNDSTMERPMLMSPKKEDWTKTAITSPSSASPVPRKILDTHRSMVLAVDATPTRVGGLLRLPGRERTIFYYSIDWTNHLEIDVATTFEMINTALALELFEPYLKAYRGRYDQFVVKTDNNFYHRLKGFKDPDDFQFLMEIRNKVKSFEGEFMHAVVSQKDPDILNADYLSRAEFTLGLKIGYEDDDQSSGGNIANYVLVNLSSVAGSHSLDIISQRVPEKYRKRYIIPDD